MREPRRGAEKFQIGSPKVIEQAIQYLIKSFDEGSYYMIHLKVEPILDPLRADSRFTDVMRRVGH